MSETLSPNACFCCAPVTGANFKTLVLSVLYVFSIIFIVTDIAHLAGVPISGFVLFPLYPAVELPLQLLVLVWSAVLLV